MQRRSTLLSLVALLGAVAAGCKDEPPTLTGGEHFPGGRPVTVQTTVSSASILTRLGAFTNLETDLPSYLLAANDFGGVLDANSLIRFEGFPDRLQYTMDGQNRIADTLTYTAGTIHASIDSAQSSVTGPVTLELWRLGQAFHPVGVTWETAVDTGAVRTPWAQPGGTKAGLIAEAVWNPAAAGDSLSFPVDSALVNLMATDSAFRGLLVTARTGNTRVQLRRFTLRAGAHPKGAPRDTVIAQTLSTGTQTFIFTPEPPRGVGVLEAGGIRGARSLVVLDLRQQVPACDPAGPSCGTVPLSEVTLNEVALLLRPAAVPDPYSVRQATFLTMREVDEAELGARAPLGNLIFAANGGLFTRGDTVAVLPLTGYVQARLLTDSLRPDTVALLAENGGEEFGVAFFEPSARLRITYTLPVPATLP
jgi:hypothetical protein